MFLISTIIELNFVHLYHRTLPVQRSKSEEDKNTRKNSEKRQTSTKTMYTYCKKKRPKLIGKHNNTRCIAKLNR